MGCGMKSHEGSDNLLIRLLVLRTTPCSPFAASQHLVNKIHPFRRYSPAVSLRTPFGCPMLFWLGPSFLDTSNASEMHSETLRSLESHPVPISALAIDNREHVTRPWSNHGQTPLRSVVPSAIAPTLTSVPYLPLPKTHLICAPTLCLLRWS